MFNTEIEKINFVKDLKSPFLCVHECKSKFEIKENICICIQEIAFITNQSMCTCQ